jgi:protein phosphatase
MERGEGMDRIAIISDVHGNLPALEAVLGDIQRRGIEKIYCLGDMVGKGPHSDTAVDRIREVCRIVVTGNWDHMITRNHDDNEYLLWHQRRLGANRLSYLASLPYHYDFYMSGRLIRLYHASAKSVYTRIHPTHPIEDRLAMFENTDQISHLISDQQPDVVGYGDIHNAFVQHIKGGKTLFNAGSVGNPLEITQASYVILEGDLDSKQSAPFSIGMVRVPYDIELAIQQAIDEQMPDIEAYAIELRTATYRGLIKK